MSAKVLAIWLDAAEPALLERMMERGALPNLARLRGAGAYGRLKSIEHSLSETVYGMVLTGRPPGDTGTWTVGKFNPQTYDEGHEERMDYGGVPFFVQLDPKLRTCLFDIPSLPLLPGLNGVQVATWGAHSPKVGPGSQPAGLLEELTARHGVHPAGNYDDHACLEDPEAVADLQRRILTGIPRRGAVACDLLGREPWDLFFMSFGEPHGGGHYFWPHPDCLRFLSRCGGTDALPAVYRAIDVELGRIVAAAGPEARTVVFSTEGMSDENYDVASFVLLPELLFRWSFPGSVGFDFDPQRGPSPEMQAGIKNWVMEVWHQRRRPRPLETWLRERLPLPWAMRLYRWLGLQPPLFHPTTADFWNFQPATWTTRYRPYMKAFALISAGDGLVRLNVRGRERRGLVAAADFTRTLVEIETMLGELREPGSGRPAVRKVIRMRDDPRDWGPVAHDADLVVKWHVEVRNRLVSPRFGALGPAPFHRTSSHSPDGFVCAAGPGIAPARLATGTPLDVAATLLALAGSSRGAALPGRCLLPEAVRLAA